MKQEKKFIVKSCHGGVVAQYMGLFLSNTAYPMTYQQTYRVKGYPTSFPLNEIQDKL